MARGTTDPLRDAVVRRRRRNPVSDRPEDNPKHLSSHTHPGAHHQDISHRGQRPDQHVLGLLLW